jgi:hypothetical protein
MTNRIIQKRAYNTDIILNLSGFILLTSILYVTAYVAIFLFNYRFAFYGAWAAVGVLFLIGSITHYRRWCSERDIVSVPWDINSLGSYVVAREVLKVTGPAYVVSEFVMTGVACLFTVLSRLRLKKLVLRLSQVEYSDAINNLRQAAKREQRFILPHEVGVDFEVIKTLLLCDIVWVKKDTGGVVRVGLNRDFDQDA